MNDSTVRSYIAIALHKSTSDSPTYSPLYQEDVILVHAASESAARAKAEGIGLSCSTSYLNGAGELVRSSFIKPVDVQEVLLNSLSEDGELYSRHFRDIDAYSQFDPLYSDGRL